METKKSDGILVVKMVPRFDAYSAKEVEADLNESIENGTDKILCDFSETEYISSAGLRVLLATAKKLKKSGGEIVLSSLKPYVNEVFETAGFTPLFNIYASEKEALAGMK
ncbi:MAG: STAS domain-containing protein [Candidatus Euphemobacter frigidus]|nr:STAS domain-containing protein [Candidatus Euphemobacter frigidus]MDP8275941.1 STAS domain-containing protein [Candidatus Euphemobacter frigidus]